MAPIVLAEAACGMCWALNAPFANGQHARDGQDAPSITFRRKVFSSRPLASWRFIMACNQRYVMHKPQLMAALRSPIVAISIIGSAGDGVKPQA